MLQRTPSVKWKDGSQNGRNILKSDIEVLVSRIYEESIQQKNRDKKIWFWKWAKNIRYVFRENSQIANKHMKKYSTSLVIS